MVARANRRELVAGGLPILLVRTAVYVPSAACAAPPGWHDCQASSMETPSRVRSRLLRHLLNSSGNPWGMPLGLIAFAAPPYGLAWRSDHSTGRRSYMG